MDSPTPPKTALANKISARFGCPEVSAQKTDSNEYFLDGFTYLKNIVAWKLLDSKVLIIWAVELVSPESLKRDLGHLWYSYTFDGFDHIILVNNARGNLIYRVLKERREKNKILGRMTGVGFFFVGHGSHDGQHEIVGVTGEAETTRAILSHFETIPELELFIPVIDSCNAGGSLKHRMRNHAVPGGILVGSNSFSNSTITTYDVIRNAVGAITGVKQYTPLIFAGFILRFMLLNPQKYGMVENLLERYNAWSKVDHEIYDRSSSFWQPILKETGDIPAPWMSVAKQDELLSRGGFMETVDFSDIDNTAPGEYNLRILDPITLHKRYDSVDEIPEVASARDLKAQVRAGLKIPRFIDLVNPQRPCHERRNELSRSKKIPRSLFGKESMTKIPLFKDEQEEEIVSPIGVGIDHAQTVEGGLSGLTLREDAAPHPSMKRKADSDEAADGKDFMELSKSQRKRQRTLRVPEEEATTANSTAHEDGPAPTTNFITQSCLDVSPHVAVPSTPTRSGGKPRKGCYDGPGFGGVRQMIEDFTSGPHQIEFSAAVKSETSLFLLCETLKPGSKERKTHKVVQILHAAWMKNTQAPDPIDISVIAEAKSWSGITEMLVGGGKNKIRKEKAKLYNFVRELQIQMLE